MAVSGTMLTHGVRPSTSPRRDESDVGHDITNHRWEIKSVKKGDMLFLTAGITPLPTETSGEQTRKRPLLKLWRIQKSSCNSPRDNWLFNCSWSLLLQGLKFVVTRPEVCCYKAWSLLLQGLKFAVTRPEVCCYKAWSLLLQGLKFAVTRPEVCC